MRYRVHYCVDNQRRTAEVEARSPQEAVVKFRHTRSSNHRDSAGRPSEILSVCPDLSAEEMSW